MPTTHRCWPAYGVPLSVEDIAKINSEEGLEFEYPTRPNATSRMAMYVENLEGLANDLSSGTTAVAEVRSKPRADAPRVESPLFDDLCGEWTANRFRIGMELQRRRIYAEGRARIDAGNHCRRH